MSETVRIGIVWLVLMALLGTTMLASTQLAGSVGLVVGLSIATAKASVIFWRYMHLHQQPGLSRIAALGALMWLFVLILLSGVDYLSRPLS